MIRVLLADDHAVVRDGLRALLEAQPGIDVVGDVENGRQAVREAQKLQPDVVVMDIAMPDLNGIEATLQMQDASPATQVLILSMHSTTEHIFRALQAGARGYLLKDSAGAEVVEAVRVVHAGRRYLSHKIAATGEILVVIRHSVVDVDQLGGDISIRAVRVVGSHSVSTRGGSIALNRWLLQ